SGPGDDRVDPDRPDAFAAEQLICRTADSLAPAVGWLFPVPFFRPLPLRHGLALHRFPRDPAKSIPAAVNAVPSSDGGDMLALFLPDRFARRWDDLLGPAGKGAGAGVPRVCEATSLRRHCPDQVQRVAIRPLSLPATARFS